MPAATALIRFADLARFAEREMAFNEGQLSTFVTTNGFDPGFVLVPGSKRAHPRIGDYVDAEFKDGRWYPGRIDKVDGAKFWICWVGYKESENEWVEERNTRAYAPKQHPAGTRVQVEWQGTWYPAHVLASRWGMHLIHYDGFEPHWDEWVAPKRMRVSG